MSVPKMRHLVHTAMFTYQSRLLYQHACADANNYFYRQDFNATAENCRRGDAAYRELEKTCKQVQASFSGAVQDCQNIQACLEQQSISVQQEDARLGPVLPITTIARPIAVFINDR